MKNRVAAQSARDRKKAKMDELEDTLKALAKERATLLRANEALSQRNRQLLSENNELKVQIANKEEPNESKSQNIAKAAFESAAFTSVRQQYGQTAFSIVPILISLLTMVSLSVAQKNNSCFKCCPTALKSCSYSQTDAETPMECLIVNQRNHQPWWGSHQKSWNPAYIWPLTASA
jgi:X box-binding protein 1